MRCCRTAHLKGLLHGLMLGVLAASAHGGAFKLGPKAATVTYWLIVGGCWIGMVADIKSR
jgi:hypothetical protein